MISIKNWRAPSTPRTSIQSLPSIRHSICEEHLSLLLELSVHTGTINLGFHRLLPADMANRDQPHTLNGSQSP